MPVKVAKTQLSGVVPTAEEIEYAKKVLAEADDKKLKSLKGSMAHFLKENPDAIKTGDRGEVRADFLSKFLVHQLRCKNAKKETVSTRNVEHEVEKIKNRPRVVG